jgi:hypothetical protein
MKKILFLTGDFAEDYETVVPVQMLEMVGYKVHSICSVKKKGETIKTAIHDFESDLTYTEKPGHNFMLNYSFDKVNVFEFFFMILKIDLFLKSVFKCNKIRRCEWDECSFTWIRQRVSLLRAKPFVAKFVVVSNQNFFYFFRKCKYNRIFNIPLAFNHAVN